VEWAELMQIAPQLVMFSDDVVQQVSFDVKYSGYIDRQQVTIDRQKRLANKRIPDWFDYGLITQLRMEAKEKLTRVRPLTLDQAQRISGITPADIALVMVHLEQGYQQQL
jgi:tRNA uridine 5-carboxymethylaminomethyl modification enzyme